MRTVIRIRRRIRKAEMARRPKIDILAPVITEWYKHHDMDFCEAANMCPDMFWDEADPPGCDVDAWMEPV